MTRKWDPNLEQYRDQGKFAGNNQGAPAGGLTTLTAGPAMAHIADQPVADFHDDMDGESLIFDGDELGIELVSSNVFIDVNEDGTMSASVETNPYDLYAIMGDHLRSNPDAAPTMDEEGVENWVYSHGNDVKTFLEGKFRCTTSDNDWDEMSIYCDDVDLPQDITAGDLGQEVLNKSDVAAITQYLEGNEFPRELHNYLSAKGAERS